MKLHDMLHATNNGRLPAMPQDGIGGQDVNLKTIASYELAPPSPYAGSIPTYSGGPPSPFTYYSGCWAWVGWHRFHEIDVELLSDTENELGFSWDRDPKFYPVCEPRPDGIVQTGYANHVFLGQHINDRWWGVMTAAYDCTTTSTTTRPPCGCTQTYPDMRVTISGVANSPSSYCDKTDFCTAMNRTFCLRFFANPLTGKCTWYSGNGTGYCQASYGNTYGSLDLRLNWPTVPSYRTQPAYVAGDCTYAELQTPGATYYCLSFDPNTGGTFTLFANSVWIICQGWPTTLTVTADGACTTTTSTTSTTTTTTTTSTTTSTTTGIPFIPGP